jgi:hypothetical protein
MTDTTVKAVSLAPYAPPPDAVFQLVSDFTAPLQTEYDLASSTALGYDVWRVTSAFKFYLGNIEDDTWVYVPAGYLSDGASVPRVFWELIPPWGPYGQAAVVHDMLCEYLTVFKGDGTPVSITRKHADNILKEAMLALGVPNIERWAIYNAVKAFTFTEELFKGPTPPQAFGAKRALEDAWKPADDVAAELKDTTANSPT